MRGTREVQIIPKTTVKIPKRENCFQSLNLRKNLEVFGKNGKSLNSLLVFFDGDS